MLQIKIHLLVKKVDALIQSYLSTVKFINTVLYYDLLWNIGRNLYKESLNRRFSDFIIL